MSKETVYHGRQDDVQSVHSMYELTERDRKLKPGWKILVGGLCTLAMLLECTNVVLSSRMENKDPPIDYEMRLPRVLPVKNDTMCEHGLPMEVINSTLGKAASDSRCALMRDEY